MLVERYLLSRRLKVCYSQWNDFNDIPNNGTFFNLSSSRDLKEINDLTSSERQQILLNLLHEINDFPSSSECLYLKKRNLHRYKDD